MVCSVACGSVVGVCFFPRPCVSVSRGSPVELSTFPCPSCEMNSIRSPVGHAPDRRGLMPICSLVMPIDVWRGRPAPGARYASGASPALLLQMSRQRCFHYGHQRRALWCGTTGARLGQEDAKGTQYSSISEESMKKMTNIK